ncbi:MAG TPA: hypothetical protein VHK88_15635, partial [Aquihabitans sp.]|nr:hypothetical protein [Aquihabitans sp.]
MIDQRFDLLPDDVARILDLAQTAPASVVRDALGEAVAGIVELTASESPAVDGGHLLDTIRHE